MRNVSAFHFETTTCPTCSLRETSSPRSRFWNFLKKSKHWRMPKKPSVYIFLYFPNMFPKEPDWVFQLKLRPQNPLYLRKPLGEPAGVESEAFFFLDESDLDPNVSRLQMDILVIKDQNTWNRQVKGTTTKHHYNQ